MNRRSIIEFREALGRAFDVPHGSSLISAAANIYCEIEELQRRGRSIAVRRDRGRLNYSDDGKPRKALNDLNRLQRLADNADPYQWVRAWQESHPDAIASLLFEASATGAKITDDYRVDRPAKPNELAPHAVAAAVNGRSPELATDSRMPLSGPVPSPSSIRPFLPAAIGKATATARNRTGARDAAAASILRSFSRLTETPLTQPANAGKGPRSNRAVYFLIWLDEYFGTDFFRALVRSGASLSRVIQQAR